MVLKARLSVQSVYFIIFLNVSYAYDVQMCNMHVLPSEKLSNMIYPSEH